jgi:hypothetical protein
MSTQRQTPRSKSRNIASQPAAQQSSPQSMSGQGKQVDGKHVEDRDRQRDALDNQGAQGRHVPFSLREEEDDDTATRH